MTHIGIRTVTGTTAIRIMYTLGRIGVGDGGVVGGITPITMALGIIPTTDVSAMEVLTGAFTPIGFSEVVDITTLLAL